MKFRVAQEHVQARRAGRAARPQAAERHARPAGLRHRAAGEVQEPPRAVAGSRAAGALRCDEIDSPEFWKFVDAAVAGFDKFADRVQQNPEDVMPWKVLGRKWHFARKGFPPGKPPQWDVEVLEELCELLAEAPPQGQFLWNNQQVVHVYVPQQHEPWATIHTKRTAAIDLALTGPKGRFALGRITELGAEREFQTGPQRDTVRLRFRLDRGSGQGDLRRISDRAPGQSAGNSRTRIAERQCLTIPQRTQHEAVSDVRTTAANSIPVPLRGQLPVRRQPGRRSRRPSCAVEYRLPSLGELEGQRSFADVRAAWSEAGLAFSVRIEGKRHPSWCRETKLEDSDALQVWIDTRDTHNIHRASRFCHRFIFLPAGGGRNLISRWPINCWSIGPAKTANPVRPGQLAGDQRKARRAAT